MQKPKTGQAKASQAKNQDKFESKSSQDLSQGKGLKARRGLSETKPNQNKA